MNNPGYMNEGLRAIMNQGAGFSDLLVPAGVLAGISLVFLLAGSRMFKWN
ncbi:MAG: hypothetical protein JRI97_03920 [Deltaproteobacteria bacterium]|nr:hypothetical protein [Deltaproteobacteria bacterium]